MNGPGRGEGGPDRSWLRAWARDIAACLADPEPYDKLGWHRYRHLYREHTGHWPEDDPQGCDS